MSESDGGCAVCGAVTKGGPGMARVIIEGRALALCLDHAATVAIAMPRTFEEMRGLFVSSTSTPKDGGHSRPLVERRSPISRRAPQDRRNFPPRIEGRRMGFGRRSTDPTE
jgi:hypothetical protein